MKLLFYIIFFTIFVQVVAQPIAGTTGLLNIPTADMQEDGTFMTGANFLPVALTPDTWDYNTGNYYLNITFLPFMEISYRMTLFKLAGSDHFNNQDRSLSTRFRLLKEKEILPSLVIGSNDIYSSTGGFSVNRYFTSFYLVSSKKFSLKKHKFNTTLGYMHIDSNSDDSAGIFGGVSFAPSILPNLNLMAEYDSKVINAGAGLLLFNHVYLYGMAHELKRFSGGFAFFVYLNN